MLIIKMPFKKEKRRRKIMSMSALHDHGERLNGPR